MPYLIALIIRVWQCDLKHELSPVAQTLRSWVQFQFEGWTSACIVLCRERQCDMLITRQTVWMNFYSVTSSEWEQAQEPNLYLLNNTNYESHNWAFTIFSIIQLLPVSYVQMFSAACP
jgi:hypothetical protein